MKNNNLLLLSCILSAQAINAADAINNATTKVRAIAFLSELLSKEKIVVSKDDLAIAQSEAEQSEHEIMLKAMELLKKYPKHNDYSVTLWNRNYTETDKKKNTPNSTDMILIDKVLTYNPTHKTQEHNIMMPYLDEGIIISPHVIESSRALYIATPTREKEIKEIDDNTHKKNTSRIGTDREWLVHEIESMDCLLNLIRKKMTEMFGDSYGVNHRSSTENVVPIRKVTFDAWYGTNADPICEERGIAHLFEYDIPADDENDPYDIND